MNFMKKGKGLIQENNKERIINNDSVISNVPNQIEKVPISEIKNFKYENSEHEKSSRLIRIQRKLIENKLEQISELSLKKYIILRRGVWSCKEVKYFVNTTLGVIDE